MSDPAIALLRATLPATITDPIVGCEWLTYELGRVTVDLEWHREHDCPCGMTARVPGLLELVGIGNRSFVVQFDWQALNNCQQDQVRRAIEQYVRAHPVVYHNAVADIKKMREYRFVVSAETHLNLDDTMLADAVLHAEEDHDLGDVNRRLGTLPEWKHLWATEPALYNAADIVAPLFIMERLEELFVGDPRAEMVYRTQSLPLIPHIIAGEERGIAVNPVVAYQLKDKFDRTCEQASRLAQAYVGYPLNLGSPEQLKHALYVMEKLPIQWDKKSQFDEAPKATTDKDAIAELRKAFGTEWDAEDEPTLAEAEKNIDAGGHPLLEARYLYFGAQQARSHYVEPCLIWDGDTVVGVRDRVYPQTHIHAQASGRHSIVKPPMTQLKRENFRLVTPDPGWPWFGFDWSNIETWLLGYLAGDERILEAKRQGWDTHTVNFCDLAGIAYPPILTKAIHTAPCSCGASTIAAMNGTHLEACPAGWREKLNWRGDDDIRRTFAKRAIFRTHYRGNPEHMGDIPGAKMLKMDAERMTAAVNRYLSKHAAIPAFWRNIEHQVDTAGVVYTWDGRPRRLTAKHINARYREACNHPLQGGVAGFYNQTYLLVKKLLPDARFVTGAFDAQWWAFPEDLYDVYATVVMQVAQRTVKINGYDAFFPASIKEKRTA